jgi:hypothetical protein
MSMRYCEAGPTRLSGVWERLFFLRFSFRSGQPQGLSLCRSDLQKNFTSIKAPRLADLKSRQIARGGKLTDGCFRQSQIKCDFANGKYFSRQELLVLLLMIFYHIHPFQAGNWICQYNRFI